MYTDFFIFSLYTITVNFQTNHQDNVELQTFSFSSSVSRKILHLLCKNYKYWYLLSVDPNFQQLKNSWMNWHHFIYKHYFLYFDGNNTNHKNQKYCFSSDFFLGLYEKSSGAASLWVSFSSVLSPVSAVWVCVGWLTWPLHLNKWTNQCCVYSLPTNVQRTNDYIVSIGTLLLAV